jgi:RNA polymerase sigma-70 factor, ECF subfamily
MQMNEREHHNLFSELIARHQGELYTYIFAVVRNWQDADDLFQSVCVVLWRKFHLFRPGTSFFSWARQTARFEISKFLEKRRSPNYATEEILDDLAETVTDVRSDPEERPLLALERCREKLRIVDEELLELHYVDDLSSRQIADRLQRSQSSVCNSLNRIRNWLLDCVQAELARQEHSGRRRS